MKGTKGALKALSLAALLSSPQAHAAGSRPGAPAAAEAEDPARCYCFQLEAVAVHGGGGDDSFGSKPAGRQTLEETHTGDLVLGGGSQQASFCLDDGGGGGGASSSSSSSSRALMLTDGRGHACAFTGPRRALECHSGTSSTSSSSSFVRLSLEATDGDARTPLALLLPRAGSDDDERFFACSTRRDRDRAEGGGEEEEEDERRIYAGRQPGAEESCVEVRLEVARRASAGTGGCAAPIEGEGRWVEQEEEENQLKIRSAAAAEAEETDTTRPGRRGRGRLARALPPLPEADSSNNNNNNNDEHDTRRERSSPAAAATNKEDDDGAAPPPPSPACSVSPSAPSLGPSRVGRPADGGGFADTSPDAAVSPKNSTILEYAVPRDFLAAAAAAGPPQNGKKKKTCALQFRMPTCSDLAPGYPCYDFSGMEQEIVGGSGINFTLLGGGGEEEEMGWQKTGGGDDDKPTQVLPDKTTIVGTFDCQKLTAAAEGQRDDDDDDGSPRKVSWLAESVRDFHLLFLHAGVGDKPEFADGVGAWIVPCE